MRQALALVALLGVGMLPAVGQTVDDESEAEERGGRLTEIVVTATTHEQDLRDAPASMSIITEEDLRERPVADVLEAVRETPGITLQSTGGSFNRPSISIRGMSSDHSLMLVNGRRINASDEVLQHSDYQFDWVPVELIERIEVVRGPMSSLYGSEAFGGVVNVITRAPTDQWRAGARVMAGIQPDFDGGNQGSGSGYLSGPLLPGKIGMTLGVGGFSRADLPDPDDDRDPALSRREGKRYVNGNLGLVFTPTDGQRIDLDLAKTEERRWPWRLESTGGDALIFKSNYEISRTHYAVTHQGEFNRFNTRLRAYRSEVDVTNTPSDERVSPSAKRGQRDDVFDGQLMAPLGERQLLTLGAERFRHHHIHESFDGGEASATLTAFFAQDEIFLGDNLALTLGLRHDHHSMFGGEWSPRAYLVWHPAETLTLRAGYGHGFKAPHLKYLVDGYESGRPGMDLLPNPNLRPETVDSFEIGVEWDSKGRRLSAVAFQSNLDDLIVSEDIKPAVRDRGQVVENGEFWRVNVEKARVRGVESALAWPLPHGFEMGLNHTWLQARNLAENEPLTGRPRNTVNARLGWQGENGWSALLRASHTGRQYTAIGRGADRRLEKLPAFTFLHVGAGKRINERLTLRAGVENLTNLQLQDKSEHFGYADRGRFYYLSVEGRL